MTFSFVIAVIYFVGLFIWHRREVKAGRREAVWFGKNTKR
jgi:hypothetical protein